MNRVAGKVALVTGGASGIGAECARLLAREGASVVIADIQNDLGHDVADQITTAGGTAMYADLDITDETAWIALMDSVVARFGGLNIAVNNAGTTVRQNSFPSEASLEEWRHILNVNLDGVFLGTKHALATMMKTTPVNGSIINISSVLGIVGQPGIGSYNASKGGVRIYSKSVALSCCEARVNVRVNTVHPGFIRTPLLDRAVSRFADPQEGWAKYDALQPIGHLGLPEDIAYGVLYLASDESKFVTGTELVIDGGFTAR
ncbi:MAG: glucose 1-dehydrogenase [Gemmobacter sp.]|jgi:3(or 17)beta-hydroxysteroid dehydrogenase|nr:glucose 1-dehydrogenase [Gemmobacter sp.]